MATTPRLGLPYPVLSSGADVPQWMHDLATALDIAVVYGQGLDSARPAFGIPGRLWYSTNTGEVDWDTGTAWVPVGSVVPNSVGTAALQANAVTTAKIALLAITTGLIADGAVTSAKIQDATIVAADIAAALFPSGGAANGTEAFRAIGSGAGQVVAGNDARLATIGVGHDPSAYGTVFPTAGLFNGYEFKLFLTNPMGGSNMYNCIYRADLDATYPWHATGAPIMSQIDADETTTSATYAALGTAGPSITPARAGVYIVEIGAWAHSSGSDSFVGYMSYDIGGTGAADADALYSGVSNGGTTASPSGTRKRVKTLSVAATALVSKYRTSAGGFNFYHANRWMAVTPIRMI